METSDFIEKYLHNRYLKGDIIVEPQNCTWLFLEFLKDSTKFVDYGCNFNVKGDCKKYKSITKCCCSNCKFHIGYLYMLKNNLESLKKIAHLYNKTTGFWRKEKGCILPRKYRSQTCVCYHCGLLKNKNDKALLLLIRLFESKKVRNDVSKELEKIVTNFCKLHRGSKKLPMKKALDVILKEFIKTKLFSERR